MEKRLGVKRFVIRKSTTRQEGGERQKQPPNSRNEQSRSKKKNEQEVRCQICTKQSERMLRQPDGEQKVAGMKCERKADNSDRISLCRDYARKSN